ncbi:unnamed protein product, partial [Mesorhabditis belari]
MILRLFCLLFLYFLGNLVSAQQWTKALIDMCDASVPGSCGPYGWCETRKSGNRCHCQIGRMGIKCL